MGNTLNDGFRPPAPIQAWHETDSFCCGEDGLDHWLKKRALKNEKAGVSRTYVLALDKLVVGYYALAAGSVARSAVSGTLRRNMPDPIPVMILARLAVDKGIQGQGIGKALLRDAILRTMQAANIAGMRALLVHALHERAAAFYLDNGFSHSPLDKLTLMLSLSTVNVTMDGV